MIDKEVHKRDNVTFAVAQKDKEKLKGINLHQNPHLRYFHEMQWRNVLGKIKIKKVLKTWILNGTILKGG